MSRSLLIGVLIAVLCLVVIDGLRSVDRLRRVRRASRRLHEPVSSRDGQQLVWRTQSAMVRGVQMLLALPRNLQRSPAQTHQLATMLDGIARRCASGQSLTAAFMAEADRPGSQNPLPATVNALRTGAAIDVALAHETTNDADVELAIHVLRLCARHGGSVSESLDRAAATLRGRDEERSERLAQAAQARLSAKVLTVVPLAFAGWTISTTESVRTFVGTPIGAFCMVAGVFLNVAGWWLMSHTIRALS